MIVRILKNASSFRGVAYSEEKNKQGKSELLVAKNFGIITDNPSQQEYISYMNMVSKLNPRVKNKQFHAIISCKGTEFSKNELKDIALKYLEKMGYANNPFLIYFHDDTMNNHVHLVTTRVDKKGMKVSDKLENIRSQKVIQNLLHVDLNSKVQDDLKYCKEFNYSSLSQFRVLLEHKGYKVTEKGQNLQVVKSGEVVATIGAEDLSFSQGKGARQQQLRMIFKKYNEKMNTKDFQFFLKQKFGIELIFHSANNNKIYGYSIIDNAKKNVFKGSEILKLKELLRNKDINPEVKFFNIVDEMDISKTTYSSFQKQLAELGYVVDDQGKVLFEGKEIFLDEKILQQLKYNERREVVEQFIVSNKKEAFVLSQMFFVKISDIKISDENKNKGKTSYEEIIKNIKYNSTSDNVLEKLRERGIFLVRNGEDIVLVDKNEKNIITVEQPLTKYIKSSITDINNKNQLKEILSEFLEVFQQDFGAEETDKKRRRGRTK